MDTFYPPELRDGFSPLVFVVSAVHDAKDVTATTSSKNVKPIFDRFLDAMSSLLSEKDNLASMNESPLTSYLDDDNSSDEEDEILLENIGGASMRKKVGHGFGFGRRSTSNSSSGTSSNAALDPFSSSSYHIPTNTSFAKVLGQKSSPHAARIVNISTRYGFPPSKDPEGTQNLAFELQNVLKQPIRRGGSGLLDKEVALQALFQEYPMATGILPSGWLAKHAHALPSAIMVVCTVTSSQREQAEQDRRLFETIKHLQYSIVPKRQCSIQVVGLLHDDVSDEQGTEWSRSIAQDLVLEDDARTPFTVTLLRTSVDLGLPVTELRHDGTSPFASTSALQKLHATVRDASRKYYLQQARRTKEKLARLTDDKRKSGPPAIQLSPLIVRYCFKIAIFYEVQLHHEKSLRFLSEAYRTLTRYYQWLLFSSSFNQSALASNDGIAGVSLPSNEISGDLASTTIADSSEVVEVELAEDTSERRMSDVWSSTLPVPPEDLVPQCRAVADWLNFKLLAAGLSSCTTDGLLAASYQWRQHSRVFASFRRRGNVQQDEVWKDWSYICRQRVVVSHLLDRNPPKLVGDLGHAYDEVLFRCSPWRAFESAATAALRLAHELDLVKTSAKFSQSSQVTDASDMTKSRARYVGASTDNEVNEFIRECSFNHREKALELLLRAIYLFEHNLIDDKRGFFADDESGEKSSSRTGARLYYMSGGVLLGLGRHKEAASNLSKAYWACRGWQSLELVVRQMLIECCNHYLPTQSDAVTKSSENIVSMILDSYFNAELSSEKLRIALDHFSSINGGNTLLWYHETFDEGDTGLPFTFAVSFPWKTHATSGDTVAASVVIKSNLAYAVHVNSVTLGTLAGKLFIPSHDLLCASNASEGSDGGVIIQAKSAITISTKVVLPKDLSAIAFDESGNGGEALGVAGKGSFARIAKPRTAGITSAGGARLVSEEQHQRGNLNSQGWSVKFLGGKPLLCDGLFLAFYPVQAEIMSSSRITLIELHIQKRKMRTAANIKRTPFEEENYIASAWSRPHDLSLLKGPRSVRVLGPQPEMVVTNITENLTHGKALEGTVNRFVLKLETGADECCNDIKINVSCFSVLVTSSGSTKRLVSREELSAESESSVDMSNPSYRTPILVKPCQSGFDADDSTCVGYILPSGWTAAGTGQEYSVTTVPNMKRGDSTYVQLDFFRPAAHVEKVLFSNDDCSNDENIGDVSLCKTDFYVVITYTQKKMSLEKQNQRRPKRVSRVKPVMTSTPIDYVSDPHDALPSIHVDDLAGETKPDVVSLDWSGSILWTPPMFANFTSGAKNCFPCGVRHASLRVVVDPHPGPTYETHNYVADGERVTSRCSLHLDQSMDGIQMEIVSIRFENNLDEKNLVSADLLSSQKDEPVVLYRSDVDDPCRILSAGSNICVSYTIRASLKEKSMESLSAPLGSISVDWTPVQIESALKVPLVSNQNVADLSSHGPLALDMPSTIRFTSPVCNIERTPFKAEPLQLSTSVTVATPFDIKYSISNLTTSHLSITIQVLEENLSKGSIPGALSGLLFSGCLNSQLSLGPHEKQVISFHAVAIRPGEIFLPPVRVSSDRFKSWILNDSGKRLFAFP